MGAKLGGGGGGKYTVSQNADINVTPFVDVMLVLLIIFMVSAPLATVSIRLDFPPVTPPKTNEKPKDPTVVSIMEDGSLYVSGVGSGGLPVKTSPETLIADVNTALASSTPTEERVFIQANKEVLYGKFMSVMNELQDNGYFQIGLIPEDIS